jgi:hypothetical protein
MAHIDGYADFLVEMTREKLGYDADDSSHDDEVLAKLTAGEKLSKSKHLGKSSSGRDEIVMVGTIRENILEGNLYGEIVSSDGNSFDNLILEHKGRKAKVVVTFLD